MKKILFKSNYNLFDLISCVVVFPTILRIMDYSIVSLFVAVAVLIVSLLFSERMERSLVRKEPEIEYTDLWFGCGECDCDFPCYDGKDRCLRTSCWCHKCNENNTLNGLPIATMRMILCPKCGNKRCPHASNHELECTNSNEPNQPGSVY